MKLSLNIKPGLKKPLKIVSSILIVILLPYLTLLTFHPTRTILDTCLGAACRLEDRQTMVFYEGNISSKQCRYIGHRVYQFDRDHAFIGCERWTSAVRNKVRRIVKGYE